MLSIALMLRILFISFPLMSLVIFMVMIGRTKFGQNNRISLVEGLPDILNLELGDYVEFHAENGNIIIRKDTKKYNGYDFEGDEIREKVKQLEDERLDHIADEDPEVALEKAKQEYLKDKAEREMRKGKN